MFRVIAKIIYTILLIIESLIAIRFVLHLINASADTGFAGFIYRTSDIFVNPFRGLAPDTILFQGITIDTLALVGLLIYMIMAFIAVELIKTFSN